MDPGAILKYWELVMVCCKTKYMDRYLSYRRFTSSWKMTILAASYKSSLIIVQAIGDFINQK